MSVEEQYIILSASERLDKILLGANINDEVTLTITLVELTKLAKYLRNKSAVIARTQP